MRHEVLRCYYFLGEELEKRLEHYKQTMEEHEAQKKVNDEVRDQLPKEVTKNAQWKEPERFMISFSALVMIKINGWYLSNE